MWTKLILLCMLMLQVTRVTVAGPLLLDGNTYLTNRNSNSAKNNSAARRRHHAFGKRGELYVGESADWMSNVLLSKLKYYY